MINMLETAGATRTKIWPRTEAKQANPRPRNHMRMVNTGRLGSSSNEIKRVATSMSVTNCCIEQDISEQEVIDERWVRTDGSLLSILAHINVS